MNNEIAKYILSFFSGVLFTSALFAVRNIIRQKREINIDEAADKTRKTPANFFN